MPEHSFRRSPAVSLYIRVYLSAYAASESSERRLMAMEGLYTLTTGSWEITFAPTLKHFPLRRLLRDCREKENMRLRKKIFKYTWLKIALRDVTNNKKIIVANKYKIKINNIINSNCAIKYIFTGYDIDKLLSLFSLKYISFISEIRKKKGKYETLATVKSKQRIIIQFAIIWIQRPSWLLFRDIHKYKLIRKTAVLYFDTELIAA